MEYKFEDIKKYLIENGTETEVGSGKNKSKVYAIDVCRNLHPIIVKCKYVMSGITVWMDSEKVNMRCLQYNATRDVIQCHTYHKFSYGLYHEYKWVDLKFGEDGRLKAQKGASELYLDTEEEGEEYKETFMKENWHLAEKYLNDKIKQSKLQIKRDEKKLKELKEKYELQ